MAGTRWKNSYQRELERRLYKMKAHAISKQEYHPSPNHQISANHSRDEFSTQTVYNDSKISVKKYFLGNNNIQDETISKIKVLEDRTKDETALKLDLINLDILYQWYRFSEKHDLLLEKISGLFPGDASLLFLKGLAKYYNKEDYDAMSLFKKAAQRGFEHPMLYNTMGTIHLHRGDIKSSKAMYFKALNVDPNFEIATYNIGAILSMEGELKQAEKYFFKSGCINPLYERSYVGLSKTIPYSKFNQTRSYLIKIVLVLDPKNPDLSTELNKLGMKERDLKRLLNMASNKRTEMKEGLVKIWASFSSQEHTFEASYEKRALLYESLIDFAIQL